jgi:hypothetical protein
MDFEQVKKVLQLTDAKIKKFGSVDASTSYQIHKAIFQFQQFQRRVIAHHTQEVLTRLKKQTPTHWRARRRLRGVEIFVGVARRAQYFDTQLATPSCAPARSFAA